MAHSKDEIDLFQYLKEFTDSTKSVLRKVAQNIVVFIVLIAAGLSVVYLTTRSKNYNTEALLVSDLVPADYYVELLQELNKRLEKDPMSASPLLKLDQAAVKRIKGIEAANYLKTQSGLYTDDSTSYLISIKLNVSDTSILKQLESALLAYFNNNPYLKKRKQLEITDLSQLTTNLQASVAKIDSNLNTVIQSKPIGDSNQALIIKTLLEQKFKYQHNISALNTQLIRGNEAFLIPFRLQSEPGFLKANRRIIAMILGVFALSTLVVQFIPTRGTQTGL